MTPNGMHQGPAQAEGGSAPNGRSPLGSRLDARVQRNGQEAASLPSCDHLYAAVTCSPSLHCSAASRILSIIACRMGVISLNSNTVPG